MLNVPNTALLLTLPLLAAIAAASDSKVEALSGEIQFSGWGGAAISNSDSAVTNAGRSALFFPSTSDPLKRQGFVRVVNLSDQDGTVWITAFDDDGGSHGPVTLDLVALQTAHFTSSDLEDGNLDKGLSMSIQSPSQGNWRLEFTSDLDIKVLSYIRTSDGFVTSMHDVVPSDGNTHRVAIFNPGSNYRQESLLRLVNPGDDAVSVSVRGVDDRGVAAPGGAVRFSIPPQATRMVTAVDLENGAADLEGTLGDGTGKWRLEVEADAPIKVMSLLATPTGHLTNLSTDPAAPAAVDDTPPAPRIEQTGARSFRIHWTHAGQVNETLAFDIVVRLGRSGGWTEECRVATFPSDGEQALSLEFTTSQDLPPGTVIQGRYRHRNGSSCSDGSPGTWSHIGETTVSGLAPADQASFDARVVGKRVLTDVTAYYLDFVSTGRFQENEGDAVYTGDYTYRYAGPDSGVVELSYDDGDSCTWNITFEQATSGTSEYSCNDGSTGTANWRLVDIPASGAPDLVVESPSVDDATPVADGSFTFSATVRNRGDGQSDSTTLRYYRSSNSTISTSDREVGTDPVGRLAASANSRESISLIAPPTAGTYYYGACVDSVSGESSTANNCSDGVRVDISGSGSGGDDYVAFSGLTIGDDGSVALTVGGINLRTGKTGCIRGIGTYNGSRYGAHWSAWQRNTGSGWTEMQGSRNDDAICGYDLSSVGSGTYRLVGDMTLADKRGLYKSANEVTR